MSATISLLVLLFIWIFSLISWIFLWALFVLIAIPFMMKLIRFYHNTNCSDLSDLFIEIEEYFTSKNKQSEKSVISLIDDEDEDW